MYTRIPVRPLDYKYRDQAKPKEILLDYDNGHIYVSDENCNIFDASTVATYIVKLEATEWIEDELSSIYYQDVDIDGIMETDYPIADIILSNDMTRYNMELSAWSNIVKISTFDNRIRAFALSKINIDINLIIKNDKTYIRPTGSEEEALNEQDSTNIE